MIYVLEWRTVSGLTRGLFWCLFPFLWSNEIPNKGNKHQNNTQVSAETVCHESTYIILFLTRHHDEKNYDKNDDLHTSTPCLTRWVYVLLMTSQSIVDDVTITRQLWSEILLKVSASELGRPLIYRCPSIYAYLSILCRWNGKHGSICLHTSTIKSLICTRCCSHKLEAADIKGHNLVKLILIMSLQKICNSSAYALELHLFCTDISVWKCIRICWCTNNEKSIAKAVVLLLYSDQKYIMWDHLPVKAIL